MRSFERGVRAASLLLPSVLLLLVAFVAAGCDSPADPESSPPSSTAAPSAPGALAASASTNDTKADGASLGDGPGAVGEPFARVVWLQDVGGGTNIVGHGEDPMVLMGAELREGQSQGVAEERTIVSEPGVYAKPLLTPTGRRVVFTDRTKNAVFTVGWNGTGQRRLARGFALATWQDPETSIEWIYVGSDTLLTDSSSHATVHRYQLGRPKNKELVWDERPVFEHSFQLSHDGRRAAGLFTWPDAGYADLTEGRWERVGEGCWTAMSTHDRPMMWYFDGAHRNLNMVDLSTDERWRVNINNAPGIDGFEVWHPRWSNHSRVMVMTGPYTVGGGTNKIRGGGRQVEIHLGRFAPDYRSVEHWVQVTDNDRPDFMPDAWVSPEWSPYDEPGAGAVAAVDTSDLGSPRIVVEARVAGQVAVPTPADIAPYKNGLLAMPYEVVAVADGTYSRSSVLVAHWVIRDGAVLPDATRPQGSVHRMTLEHYDEHPELEGQRLVMETDDFTLPLYYDVSTQ